MLLLVLNLLIGVNAAQFVSPSHSISAVSSPEIPNAALLLHADCNEQEVMCEISRYTPRGLPESSDPAYFMVSLSVEGLDFSTSLILQTLPVDKYEQTLTQNKLSLPLSQSGTLLTKGKLQRSMLRLTRKSIQIFFLFVKNIIYTKISPAFIAFLDCSDIPGILRHQFCFCSLERRSSPPLRVQAGGSNISTRGWP